MSGIKNTESDLPDQRFRRKPQNGCSSCRQDFTSLRLFDLHHVGEHALDWPEHEKGRRCLDIEEMQARGWEQDEKRRWVDPERVEDARRRLRRVAGAQTADAGPEDELEAA